MYRDRLQAVLDALQFEQPFKVILPDGSVATHGQGTPVFTIHIKTSRAARDIVMRASMGFGWGGLALHMARNYGVRVKSFNISGEQIAFARERAQALGIGTDSVEYVHDDYRNIPNHVKSCDKFASICMLEHVGRESYASF